jgi:carbonic anhydrase
MALRIKGKNGGVLGKLTDIDENVYSLDEIVFRTPSEHTIKGERFALEI